MATTSQHRCVFVGNIPYDATEEQLIQICEEVGPVVSFRLVIDRETGKPKGYGFCEYKDEETALSARRNLQGYEINGRQLRVDFAENDKNSDRNRDQGRGGPGLSGNVEPQKQFGGPAIHGDSGLLQPFGLPVAMDAAIVTAGALGGAQTISDSHQNGLQSHPVLGTDPLTLHLSKIPRNQLNEILTEMKVIATQNKEQARHLLLASPQLPKAIFQAHIMLGMVSPQMLRMSTVRQASGPLAQPPLQDVQQVEQLAAQTLPGIPPLVQNKMHLGFVPQPQSQASTVHPNYLIHSQSAALSQLLAQPQFQTPQQGQQPVLQVSTLPALHLQQPPNLSIRPEVQVATSLSMKKQLQPSLLQHPGQIAPSDLGHITQLGTRNAIVQPSFLTRPPLSDNGFQVPDQMRPPKKLLKLEDGRGDSFSTDFNESAYTSGSSQAFSMSRKAEASASQKPNSELPPDMESALLQQVLDLTPAQLSSLPPEQQQQVIQLQQMLRQQT